MQESAWKYLQTEKEYHRSLSSYIQIYIDSTSYHDELYKFEIFMFSDFDQSEMESTETGNTPTPHQLDYTGNVKFIEFRSLVASTISTCTVQPVSMEPLLDIKIGLEKKKIWFT